jgi:acyl-CoA thioesterase
LLREGRTLTHAEARLVQAGAVAALCVGVYATPRSTSLQLPGVSPPPTPAPSELACVPYVEDMTPRFAQHFEFRVPPGRALFSSSPDPRVGGYVRHAQGGPIDAAGLLGLIDAWPPAFMPSLARPAVCSSVTWMVDIMAELPARGSQSDAYFRYEAETVAARSGCASCEARLWSDSGSLIAASRQLVAEFS